MPSNRRRPHNKLPRKTEQAIATMYKVLRKSRPVAKHFRVSKTTVLRIARERGLVRSPNGISPEKVQQLHALCGTGRSGPKIAAQLGITSTTVYVHAKKAGLLIRPEYGYERDENCLHDYFDKIDTPEKAYWLGLLVTDGCISNEGEVMLGLHVRDKRLVEAFKTAVRSSAKLSVVEAVKSIDGGEPFKTTCARVFIRSRRMCAALARHCILPAKTRNPQMVTGVPRWLESHFWRGAVDGDGWICFGNRPNGRKQVILGLTCGRPIVEAFQDFCYRYTPTRAQIAPNKSVVRFVVTDWFAFTILKMMYKESTICLPRKRRMYEQIVAHFAGRTRPRRRWVRRLPASMEFDLFASD